MKESSKHPTLRRRTHEILEVARPGDRLSHITDIALMGLICLNVIAIILESMDTFMTGYRSFFIGFEAFSVLVFTVEYFARLWSCVEKNETDASPPSRLRYAVSPLAICDLVAILPSYMWLFVGMDLRFLRTLRLLRVFKLTRYSAAMSLMLKVFKKEAASFSAALSILLVVMVLAASGMYFVEFDAQPEAFGSIPAAMWWAVAALTTVGYGDVTPITPLGKFFGACITVVGIGMIALPSGILASGFSDQLNRRRKEYEQQLDDVLGEGIITESERRELEKLRDELGFTEKEATEILREASRRAQERIPHFCPYCGKSLTQAPYSRTKE